MISFLKGTIVEVNEESVVLENQGIGFLITVPSSVSRQLTEGTSTILYTHLMIRETEVALYGFLDASERRLFLSLQDVTGIGPKQALRILSELSASELRGIIIQGESSRLARIKGIGPKTASRIILELQDRMKRLPEEGGKASTPSTHRLELLMALRVLGYSDLEANRAIDSLWQDHTKQQLPLEDQVKLLLAILSRRSS
ncbi:Holliday junction branch migration protein RuvA [Thermospira aquatica]|uniref:Holliday junction branch migration complex subunit RuvA n=1 Tax=Thermospira aquatica TaxID=2828656 RepID=A0AAX3BAR8_9SPIR|nr:Holliday junction branch migration protein RuvA [Thermospira aquatica]URA09312.1 Holliday junction branch migration protein RuvA [Thermospira aquatica]